MPAAWAVGGLGEAGVAAFCALLCISVVYLLLAIENAIPNVSLGLFTLNFKSYWHSATTPIVLWLNGATAELWKDAEFWMRAVSWALTETFDGIKAALNFTLDHLAHAFNVSIPAAASHAQTQSTGYTAQEIKTLNGEITAARTDLENSLSAADRAIYKNIANATATVRNDIRAAVATGVDTSETYVNKQLTALHAYVNGQFANAEAYTDQQIGALAPPRVGAQGAQGIQGVPGAVGAAGAAAGAIAIPTGFDIPQGLTVEDITTGAVVGVGTAVAVIAREVEQCMVRSCSGPNNLSNLLQDILGFASLAEVAVFLQQVVSDPRGAEASIEPYLTSTVQGLVAAPNDIWGAIESVLGI